MKSIVVVVFVAIILGLAIGTGTATFRVRHVTPTGGAKVEVDSDAFDFGQLDATEEGSHDFVFTNKGTRPLTLSRGHTTCRCTVGEIADSMVAPGESTTVRVTWNASKSPHLVTGHTRQSVTVNTNDPNRREVILTITGTLTEAVHMDPNVEFGHFAANEPVTRESRILCSLPKLALEIFGYEFTKEDLAKFFEIQTRPMTVDELIKEKRGSSGVLVTITAKPGLPPGRFQQRILLRTNLPHPKDEIELDLSGSVGKDVSVVGSGWDDELGVLKIGPIKARTREERVLYLMARGADAAKIRYNVVHVEPDLLKVKLGEADVTDEGKLSRTKLTIEIPAQDMPATYMGDGDGKTGEIDIDTTSSEVHQVKLRVRFAVEGEK